MLVELQIYPYGYQRDALIYYKFPSFATVLATVRPTPAPQDAQHGVFAGRVPINRKVA